MAAMRPLTVLFSSAGRRVALMDCFRADAAELGVSVRVVAADAAPELSAACRSADAGYKVPRCLEQDFVPRLLDVCAKEKVSLLVPTIDTELAVLAAHRAEFEAAGVTVAVSDPATVAAARDKAETAKLFVSAGVAAPRTASAADFLARPGDWRYPVILKPRGGSSSIGLRYVRSVDEAGALRAEPDHIAQEVHAGPEYTVNMFFDRGGVLRCAVPHRRIEVRGGEVSKGVTEDSAVLREAARRLGLALRGARGALCFQAILCGDGTVRAFEVNARFGGGYPLAHRAGARFPRWLMEEVLGLPATARDHWRAGVTMLRWDAAVFIEPERGA